MSQFFDQASLVMVPSGYKNGKVYSQKPLSADGELTFTRASTATRVNASGLIEEVASGLPRLDYSGGASCGKLLLEGQRTNSVTYSEQLALQSLQGDPIITSNVAVSPDGYQNADKLTPNTGTRTYVGAVFSGMGNDTYTLSMFAKADGKDWVFFYEIGSAAGTNGVWFNVATGTVGNVGSAWSNAKIENYGNGWYRVSATTTLAGGNYLYWLASDNNNTPQLTGSGTDGMLMWGLSYEVGAYATSYIPTLSTAVTRVADAASKTGISSLIGQTEGTLFAEFVHNGADILTTQSVISVNSGNTTNFVNIGVYDGRLNPAARGSGTNIFDLYVGPNPLPAGTHKIALAYKSGDFAIYLNGTSVYTNTSAATFSLSQLDLGTFLNLNTQLGDGIKQALLFKTRLSNADLATLTA